MRPVDQRVKEWERTNGMFVAVPQERGKRPERLGIFILHGAAPLHVDPIVAMICSEVAI
jgi:hypothetical protein